MKNIITNLLMFILLCASIYFGWNAYKSAKAYESTTMQIVKQMSASKIAEQKAKSILEEWSFGLYKNKDKKRFETLTLKKEQQKTEAKQYFLYALAPIFLMLFAYILVPIRIFVFWNALGALEMLIYGIFTPIMMVTIHKQVEHFGDIILSMESKSVVSSALKLYDKGDMVVAGVLLLFSVLIPLLKTLSMFFVSLFKYSSFAHNIIKFFKHLGKWSMVDVFVVSTFLVYLTTSSGDISRAELEIGVYFFLVYVIVSMLISLSADKMLQQKKV
jgi:hypothetical protein